MSHPAETTSQPSRGSSSTIALEDAPFLRYLWEEWNKVGFPRDMYSGTHRLLQDMTLGRADLLEGAISIPAASNQTYSEIDREDDDSFDITDPTYVEPWNAVKTYQWLQGIIWCYSHGDDENASLQQLEKEVGERLFAAKSLQIEGEEIGTFEISSALDDPGIIPHRDYQLAQSTFSSTGILQLPPEILSNIFAFACHHTPYMPFIISRINTYCRDVAFSSPRLWTDISILAPPTVNSVYLERSKSVPITVDMTMIGGYPFGALESVAPLERFINMIAPYSTRIRELTLVFTIWDHLIVPLRHMQHVTLPSLESLDFGLTNAYQPSNDTTQPRDIIQAWCAKPALRLDIIGIHFAGLWKGGPPMSSVLATLKVKESRDLLLAELLDVLSSLPRLEHLTLDDCQFEGNWRCNEVRSTGTPIRLPKLDMVEMHWVWPFIDILSPASPLSAPNLKSVSASFRSTAATSGMPPWLIELSQAHTQLYNLDITGCVVTTDAWIAAFRNWNSLTSLRLMSCDLNDSDVNILSPLETNDDQPTLLPKLQNLTLDNEIHLSSTVVRDIVCQRYILSEAGKVDSVTRDVAAIKEVTLRGWDAQKIYHKDVAEIAECVERLNIGAFHSGASDVVDEGSDSDAERPSDWDSVLWLSDWDSEWPQTSDWDPEGSFDWPGT